MQGQEQERKSIADDGGLVEIQVFRAKDRRPRALKLEQFRNQEMYGIAYVISSPSPAVASRTDDNQRTKHRLARETRRCHFLRVAPYRSEGFPLCHLSFPLPFVG